MAFLKSLPLTSQAISLVQTIAGYITLYILHYIYFTENEQIQYIFRLFFFYDSSLSCHPISIEE